jgi:predicted DNA-binding protein
MFMATFSVRLTDEEHRALAAMSLLTGKTASDIAREAIARSIHEFTGSDAADEAVERAVATLRAFGSQVDPAT